MAGTGMQDRDVASLQREYPALVAAEAYPALAAGDAKHLMNSGVIMHVAVDAVAPSVAPAVGLEEILHHGRRVVPVARIDGATVDDERPSQVIGYEPSSLKRTV